MPRVVIALVVAALTVAALLCYPVGGAVWSAGQVHQLAQVNGNGRSETGSRAAIAEALSGVRADPFRRLWSAITGNECRPRRLEFLTDSGWVPATVQCPSGFFLDFVPPPGR